MPTRPAKLPFPIAAALALLSALPLLACACGGGSESALPAAGGSVPGPVAAGGIAGTLESPAAGAPPAAPFFSSLPAAPARAPLAGATVTAAGTGRFAVTGADGRYAIAGIPPGTHELYAVAVGATRYAWFLGGVVVTSGRTTEVPLGRAAAAVTAAGRVIDDRGGVMGATLHLVGRSAVTDAAGGYAIADAPPGDHIARVSAANHAGRELTVTIAPSGAVADIPLERIILPKAATPVISPAGGTTETSFTVTLACETPGVTLRYTLDGSVPGEGAGIVYAGPITIAESRTLKAVALASGMEPSEIAAASFVKVVRETTAAPAFTPPGGTYAMPVSVTLASATPGATLRYTLPASHPGPANGLSYAGPIELLRDTTIIAYASHPDRLDSAPVASAYFATPVVRVATPVITPAAGTYAETQTVEIACATPGATIRYTLNGLVPTAWSATLYTGPFRVTGRTQVRAFATASGLADSLLADAVIVVSGAQVVAAPVFAPEPGVYTREVSVTLATATPDALIRYTLDGSTPSATAGTAYAGPILLPYTGASVQTLVNACASAPGYFTSSVSSAFYAVEPPTVEPVTVDPPAGKYDAPILVGLRTATPGATIRLTLDGGEPAADCPLYAGTFEIAASATLKARASKAGWLDSPVVTAAFTLDFPNVATPVIAPNGGSFYGTREVTLACATDGATIRYTLDESSPTELSPIYSGTLSIATTLYVKAYATKPLMDPSAVASARFRITPETVAYTSSNLRSTTYTEPQWMTLACATPDATIHYTTDGSTPDASSPVYTAPFHIERTTTVKTICTKPGYLDSTISTRTVTIDLPNLHAPTLHPGSGIFSGTVQVAIRTIDADTALHYTTDGTPPDAGSPAYTGTFEVGVSTTVKAIGIKALHDPSPVASAIYTIVPETLHPPVFDPPEGAYAAPLAVSLSSATAGATIRYTLDGTSPTATSGIVYAGPFTLNSTAMVRAISLRDDLGVSAVVQAIYDLP